MKLSVIIKTRFVYSSFGIGIRVLQYIQAFKYKYQASKLIACRCLCFELFQWNMRQQKNCHLFDLKRQNSFEYVAHIYFLYF